MLETLKAGRWSVHELRFAEEMDEQEKTLACQLAESMHVPYSIEPYAELTKLCGSQEHQGYLAKMPPYPYATAESLNDHWPNSPLFLVLDGIQDPYNFGAILRSAEVLGAQAILIGTKHQVGISSQVARSSAGAVNYLQIVQDDDLSAVLGAWRSRGIEILGASEKSSAPLYTVDCTQPLALVIGNEGTGIREELLAMCDRLVAIPQSGQVGSLNAAVSAGVLLYEVGRQRNISSS